MSLAQITEKIISDATHEADEIIAKAKVQAADIARRAEDENDTVKATYERRFETEKPEIFKRREIVANLDVKKMKLQSKRDMISDVYAIALEKLGKMDQAATFDFCEKLLLGAMETKEEAMTVGKDEKQLTQAWLDGFNQKNGAKLTLSGERADISGGFILQNGKISVNCSWEMLVKVAQEQFEADVITRLFKTAE